MTLLELDTTLLISARGLVSVDAARYIQLGGELSVVAGALGLILLWLYGVYKKDTTYKTIALSIFFMVIITFVVYLIINLGIPQWRESPQLVVGGIHPFIPHPVDNSFPSGHGLFSGAYLMGLFFYLRRPYIALIFALMTIVTLTCRVIGGVHYPGDVIGGLLIGLIGASILRPVIDRIVSANQGWIIRMMNWIRL